MSTDRGAAPRRPSPILASALLIALTAVIGPAEAAGPAPVAATRPPKSASTDLSPADAAMLRWEEAAMRQGRLVCTNPSHHHRLSPQLMLLREDEESDNVPRSLGGR